MPTETGDMTILGNFRRLIDQVSAEPTYNPSNPALTLAALEAQYSAALTAVEDVAAKTAPNKRAIGKRVAAFEELESLVRRSRNLLKASGAPKDVLDNAETLVRKLLGKRKSPGTKPRREGADNQDSEGKTSAVHSASQMSYDSRLGNFSNYLAILENFETYKPNEEELKVTSLRTTAAELKAKHDAVSVTLTLLSQARVLRNELLYSDSNSVVHTAQLVKSYVSAANGLGSHLHKHVKGLPFKKQHRR